MKLHLLICGFRNASTNLDKKLPLLIKIYPDAKIEKTNFHGQPCIKGINIINDIKLIKLLDKNVDLNLIKENLLKRQNKCQEEMSKISQRLKNKDFVQRAPKHIVEQEKSNYNNLKIDIKKISLIIKNL